MKRTSLTLLLLLAVSCGLAHADSLINKQSKDDDKKFSLIGTWEAIRPLSLLYDCIFKGCSLWDKEGGDDPIVDDEFTIHIVPHSHTDAGWIESIDWYYDNLVKSIFDNILVELYENPHYTFVWADTNYLNQWFESQDKETQERFLEVVKRGQLEFAGGGWVQNDESLSDLKSIVNQMNLGLQYLHDRFNATPTVGWQIDPFGYNHFMPGVFIEMGYKYMVLNRVGDVRKEGLKNNSNMDFWLDTAEIGESDSKVLTHVLPRHYEPLNYDGLINSIPEYNDHGPTDEIKKFVKHFYETYVEQARKGFKSKHFMLLMGKDFGFTSCKDCLGNIDRLNKIMTKYSKQILGEQINCKFSKPSDYFEKVEKVKSLETLSLDFLNYDERLIYLHPKVDYELIDYWVGYYFTRPHLKKKINDAFATFRSIETLISYTKYIGKFHSEFQEVFDNWEKQLSYMLHHDAITGTSRQSTIDDYYKRLEKAEYMMNQLMVEINKVLLGKATEANTEPDENGITKKPVQYFNQAVYKREIVMPILVSEQYARVYDEEKKKYLQAEIVTTNKNNHVLYVLIEIGGLTMKSFTIETSSSSMPGHATILKGADFDPSQRPSFSNEKFTLTFSANALISKIESKVTKQSLELNQQFNYYDHSLSGLYIFKPLGDKKDIEYKPVNAQYFEGNLITFITSENQKGTQGGSEQIRQTVTIMAGDTQNAPLVQITAKPWQYVELGFSFSTKDFSDQQEFYNNDSNEFVKRTFRTIEDFDESGKNIYPAVNGLAVKDNDVLIGIVNNYPTGCGYIDNSMSTVECFLTRNTNVDDDKGVPDDLNDDKVVNYSFFLTLSTVKDYPSEYSILSDYFHLPLTTKTENESFKFINENQALACLYSDSTVKHALDNKDYYYETASFSLLKKDLGVNFEVFDIFENHQHAQFIRIRNREYKTFMNQKLDQIESSNKIDLEDSFIFGLEKDQK